MVTNIELPEELEHVAGRGVVIRRNNETKRVIYSRMHRDGVRRFDVVSYAEYPEGHHIATGYSTAEMLSHLNDDAE